MDTAIQTVSSWPLGFSGHSDWVIFFHSLSSFLACPPQSTGHPESASQGSRCPSRCASLLRHRPSHWWCSDSPDDAKHPGTHSVKAKSLAHCPKSPMAHMVTGLTNIIYQFFVLFFCSFVCLVGLVSSQEDWRSYLVLSGPYDPGPLWPTGLFLKALVYVNLALDSTRTSECD